MINGLIYQYLKLIRIPAVFTAASNIIAAHIIATQGQIDWIVLFQVIVISSLLYSAGMILNDCFDVEEDLRDRPFRPLPAGKVSIKTAWITGYALMGTAILIAIATGKNTFIITAVLVVLIISYNAYFKNTILAGVVMGSCRYTNWLLGLAIADISLATFLIPLPILIYVFSLTQLSRGETRADSKTPLVICASGMVLTAITMIILYFTSFYSSPWFMLFILPVLAFILTRIYEVYNSMSAIKIQQLVKFFILSIIPFDALLIFANGHEWGAALLLLLILPSRALARLIPVT